MKDSLPEGWYDVLVAHPCFSISSADMFGVTTRNAATVRQWMSEPNDDRMHGAYWQYLPKGPA